MINPEAWIGKKIDHFVVESYLDRGGMAHVFLARDEWLDRQVALKVLIPELNSDPDFVARFQREARAVARLRHQNIVQVYTTGRTDDGQYFMAMEYVPGGSLQQMLKQLKDEGRLLDTATAIGIVHQVAEALAVSHDAGIVHRDIKPSNILLRQDGTPVLTDLGIAKVEDKPGLTRTNALMGTPAYMAPEQITSSHVDGRSDIYSLGVIFYELFSGRRLFDGDTPWVVLNKHLSERPRPITELRQDITETTRQVIDTCLAKRPEDRYQSARELLAALNVALVAENAADKVSAMGTWIGPQPMSTQTLERAVLLTSLTPVATHPAPTAPSPTVPAESVAPPILEQTAVRPLWLIPVGVVLLLLLCVGGVFFTPLRGYLFASPPTPTVLAVLPATATQTGEVTPTQTAVPTLNSLATLETLLISLSVTPDEPEIATPTPTTAVATNTPTRTPTAIRTAQASENATATPSRTPTVTRTASSSNPVGGSSSGGGLPMTFDNLGTWIRGDEDNGSFTQSTEQSRSGASAKISYNFSTSGNDYVVFMQNNAISGTPNALQLWVYGDSAGHYLNVWIRDADGQTWQAPFGRVTHSGWKQMTAYLDTDQSWPWTVISGGDDETVDYPISFRGFVLDDLNDAYQGSGSIYLDDLTATTIEGGAPTSGGGVPVAGGTATAVQTTSPPIASGTVGRILYTSGNVILTTDPSWSTPQEVGTSASDTCSSPATTVVGQTYTLYYGPFCTIQGNGTTVCAAPNGQYEVLTNRVDNGYSIVVRLAGAEALTFIYQGEIDVAEGIRWSPLSDRFLFVVGDTVHLAFLNGGYNQIIPTAYGPMWSQDGSMILYRKPIGPGVNDIFVSNADGSNQRNVTNVAAIDKRCPAWRN